MHPLVSVVIPTYNGAQFIREALESVFAQTRPPDEIIVVDDASTDGTPDLIQDIAGHSALSLRLIRLASNSGGPARPMNIGFGHAKGDFIALLDQDDLMLPSKLLVQHSALMKHAAAGASLSEYQLFDSDGTIEGSGPSEMSAKGYAQLGVSSNGTALITAERCLSAFCLDPGLPCSCSNLMVRRKYWEALGGFDERACETADYDFMLRVAQLPIVWTSRVLVRKRVHSANLWQHSRSTQWQTIHAQQNLVRTCGSRQLKRQVLERATRAIWQARHECDFKCALQESLRLIGMGYPAIGILETMKTTFRRTVHWLSNATCFDLIS